jgi:hypothetical protein
LEFYFIVDVIDYADIVDIVDMVVADMVDIAVVYSPDYHVYIFLLVVFWSLWRCFYIFFSINPNTSFKYS